MRSTDLARPPLEQLEGRRLFAAITFANHVLTVTGSGPNGTTITVGLSADGTSVVANETYMTGQGVLLTPNLVTKDVPLSRGIHQLRIVGSAGPDTITVDQTYGSFPIPAVIYGGAGDDTISGGDEPDRIYGQAGMDSIMGNGGNDTLNGGSQADALYGGAGNDYLAGQGNQDYLSGGDGNDTLHDAVGPDTVLGGAGADVFQIHSLKRDVTNDFNKAEGDRLVLIAAPGQASSSSTGILGSLFPITSLL